MHIAILGATSQIARDFVQLSSLTQAHTYSLYARRPEAVQQWLDRLPCRNIDSIAGFESFGTAQPFDAIINFVGVGSPAAAQSIGAAILDVTHEFDSLALRYLQKNPGVRYIFLSSGAAYGSDFSKAATSSTPSSFDINHLQAQDWYGAAKFHVECRHRALPELAIVDIRVFSYFSASQDPQGRFLMSDALRSLKTGDVLSTSAENIVRDYLGPQDLNQMLQKILHAAPANAAVDCYTQQPAEKFALLDALRERFGLSYRITPSGTGLNATGCKQNYYSTHHRANTLFGYSPTLSAVDTVLRESEKFLSLLAPSLKMKSP